MDHRFSPLATFHVIMSVAGSWAGIYEALKRYYADEWREAMRSLKDAEEDVRSIMQDREIVCVVFSFFFFFCGRSFFVLFGLLTTLFLLSRSAP